MKILDFGLAKLSPANDAAAKTMTVQTVPGVVLGTVGYIAPEQVRGQTGDARSDLFAFGTVLTRYCQVSARFKAQLRPTP